jgi:predicted outer membrane repeat protein
MNKSIQKPSAGNAAKKPSAFVRPTLKRGLAIIGTSGLVFGLGITSSAPAVANGVIVCTDGVGGNTVTQGVSEAATLDAIEAILLAGDTVCLSGDIVMSETLYFTKHIEVKGLGEASIETLDSGGVFLSDDTELGVPRFDITIETLNVRNAGSYLNPDPAVFGRDVEIIDSTFEGNSYGAIIGGDVLVENSTFINNSSDEVSDFDGGAIRAEGTVGVGNSTFVDNLAGNGGAIWAGAVAIANSTFVNNSADGDGGAILAYAVLIENSTFVNNSAEAEGGAIYAATGDVYFSTFVNNVAPTPDDEPADIPGNSIYKRLAEPFALGGNIFAGNNNNLFPQLGTGAPVSDTPFTDAGGNIFSTSAEPDISGTYAPVFGATLTSLFGTNSPTLATYAPNTNGTKTIALAPGSPALNAVPDLAPFNLITLDQRGATRSFPADAGAFEGFVIPTSTPTSTTPAVLAKTGNENLFWSTLASGTLIVFGTLVAVVISRIRRRTSNL